ncbi:MAG: hypothetical protein SGPRY_002929 [Prymnesium sp.]
MASDEGSFSWARHGKVMCGKGCEEIEVEAYGAKEALAPLELMKVKLPPLRSTQVQIEMSHCGLCHTEVHMLENDWGISNFPLVPGHEGYGKVVIVGSDVTKLKVGDAVGVGWIRDSCSSCRTCCVGRENLCAKGYQGTYLGPNAAGIWGNQAMNTNGCFAKVMRIEAPFVFKIPENCPPTIACPLMCAGGTVTALSRSAAKKDMALSAGADAFIAMDDAEAVKAAACTFDFILDTSPANSDPAVYQDMLSFSGVFVRVGIPAANDSKFTYNWIPLIFTQRTIAGSIVTGSNVRLIS